MAFGRPFRGVVARGHADNMGASHEFQKNADASLRQALKVKD
jgi:hypothetical protein